MSFLTEYIDEYREHPIKKTKILKPTYVKLEGKWLDPKIGKEEKELTDEEIKQFIKDATRAMRGQSTYFNTICAHLDQSFKTRPFVPKAKKKPVCKEEAGKKEKEEEPEPVEEAPKLLSIKDTELMKEAKELYERDMDEPTLQPLDTHPRILGYVRPSFYKTGITEYQHTIGRTAYEVVMNDKVPRIVLANGGKAKWGYPPEGVRQPLLDGAPYDGERLY